tara:strand:- start:4040 stop:4642 length:603 start_codon:yes stop_codon:yes gene_type:complete
MANNGRQHDFGHWGNLAGRSPIENPELGWGGRPPPVNIEGALNRGDQFAHRDVEVPYRYRGQPSFDSPITNEQFKLTPVIKQLILDQVMLEDPDATKNMVETFGYGAVDRVVREFLARSNLHSEQDTWVGDGPAPEYVRQGLLHEEAKKRPEEAESWPVEKFPTWSRLFPGGGRDIGNYRAYPQGSSVVPKPNIPAEYRR